jgi:hypothetical protein
MNYIVVENKKKYIDRFSFVPLNKNSSLINKNILYEYDDTPEYINFNPSQQYAYKEQLQKFINETNNSIDNTYINNGQCGIQRLPRNEMLKLYIPDGDCKFINQTITSIKTYFIQNNLSFDNFVNTYPTHNIIFDTNISNYDKIHYISNKYEEIEKNINRMRWY